MSAAALLLALTLPLARAFADEAVFRGESCKRCHAAIRDAAPAADDAPAQELEAEDVIVVGGGLSGLSAAYALRDRSVLVLEKEDKPGGKVRRELWGRARYPVAAGYMAQLYDPDIEKLFAALALKGDVIPEPGNRFYEPGKKAVGDDPFEDGFTLKKLAADMAALSKDPEFGSVPPVPPIDKMTPLQKTLDAQSFADYVESHYGAGAGRFAQRYALSLFGVGARQVSALTGLVFFSADFGGGASITWDGGPGAISEKLAEALGPRRLQLGALVTAVRPDEGGVVVDYELNGRKLRRRARAVVMAIPGFVAKRLVRGLPDWKTKALSRLRYSAYAVAIVALDKTLYRESFDLWATGLDAVFTDLEPLDWGRHPGTGPGTPAQILEAFIPLGEDEGRRKLLQTSDAIITQRVIEGLERLLPGAVRAVHGVRVLRWGHAMPVDYPGYLTTVRPDVAKPAGRVVFAGVDSQMPCIEGAVLSGLDAARQARALAR